MPLFEPGSILKVGSSFGGLALTRGSKRTATCIAKSKRVSLLSLSKRIYRKINLEYIRKVEENIRVLKVLFPDISEDKLNIF